MVNRILAVSLALSLLTLCFGAPAETAVEETAAEAVQETAAEAVREAAEEATESVQEVAE